MGGKKTRQARERESREHAPDETVNAAEFVARSNGYTIQAYSQHVGQWWVTFHNPKAEGENAQFSVSTAYLEDVFNDWLQTEEGQKWQSGTN